MLRRTLCASLLIVASLLAVSPASAHDRVVLGELFSMDN